jgi:hypothetical protein
MGEVCVTHARRYDSRSELALSSLIWALSELESYAVARIVTKDGKDPLLVLLAPSIDSDMECLYDIPLPFAEDVRSYQFPPLDKVITVSGQTVTKHRLLPSDELAEAMSDYVDAMDLSKYGIDDEGYARYGCLYAGDLTDLQTGSPQSMSRLKTLIILRFTESTTPSRHEQSTPRNPSRRHPQSCYGSRHPLKTS